MADDVTRYTLDFSYLKQRVVTLTPPIVPLL